jgi:hypothetical protein
LSSAQKLKVTATLSGFFNDLNAIFCLARRFGPNASAGKKLKKLRFPGVDGTTTASENTMNQGAGLPFARHIHLAGPDHD